MTPNSILKRLWSAGVHLELAGNDRLFAKPADRMTDELRGLCRDHKAELIDFLQQAEATAQALIGAAMRACDAWNDSPESREQMRREVLETPPHQRADLLEHFRSAYATRPNKPQRKSA